MRLPGIETRDIQNIEPWLFLNALNKLANNKTSKPVMKIDAFVKTPLGDFKDNEKEYEKYKTKKEV
jgi:hypothetical protein